MMAVGTCRPTFFYIYTELRAYFVMCDTLTDLSDTVWLQQSRESWQIVFFIAAGVYAFGAITYCVLASGTIQPWASDAVSTTEVELMNSVTAEGSDKRCSPIYRSKIISDKESLGPMPEPV
jgi:hypothetical protein